MGYHIAIGNAVPEFSKDDGFLWCGIYHENGQVDHFNISSEEDKLKTLWMPNCG